MENFKRGIDAGIVAACGLAVGVCAVFDADDVAGGLGLL
jgi:hypothetical protein